VSITRISSTLGKFIIAIIDSVMHLIPQDKQPPVPTLAVRVNDHFQLHLFTINRLQRRFRAIMYNFRIDLAIPLKDAKDNDFPISPSAPFFLHPSAESKRNFHRLLPPLLRAKAFYPALRSKVGIRLQEYAHDECTDFPIMLYKALW